MKDRSKKISDELNAGSWLCALAVLMAFAFLAMEYGFRITPLPPAYLHAGQVAAAVMMLAGKLYQWGLLQRRAFQWHEAIPDMILLCLILLGLGLAPQFLKDPALTIIIRWAIFQTYLLIIALLYLGRFSVIAASSGRAPTRALLLSFGMVILMGAILLMLPAAHRQRPLSFTDAVFTATSATCVTGLIVQDTGSDFTPLGQTIILIMIQAGGIGIMIFGSLFALLLGSPLSMRESVAMRDIMNEQAPGRVGKMVVFIFISTFLFEALGAAGLYGMWQGSLAPAERIYRSVFHAISAFCNAGFSLQSDSLISYRDSWQPYLVICPLIIIGGLGFPVLHNLWVLLRARWRKRRQGGNHDKAYVPTRMSLHSKLALTATAALLVGGMIALVIVELTRPDVKTNPSGMTFLDAFFNSVTARTAGFNTVNIKERSAGAKLVLIFLMCVGGSPSSTAGGIKTVTFMVMVLLIYSTMRRHQQVVAFHRTIPVMILRRAATMVILYGLILWFFTLLLTITESSLGVDLMDLFFEVSSALGTVGLSTGVTGQLTLAGKWVIILAMFIGRLGPLSLLAALTFNTTMARYDYPYEPLVVG